MMQLFDFVGVAVFAISGALAAGRKRLDLLGVIVIAMVTAIGGGTMRDLLLGRTVFWIPQPQYLYIIVIAALVTILYTRHWRPPRRTLVIADALGLALFAISGAQIARSAGVSAPVVVIMGTMTGAAGGLIRDILTAEIPMILRRGQIYATAAIIGVVLFLLLLGVVPAGIAAITGMATIAGVRIAGVVWNISLPVFRVDDDSPGGVSLSDQDE